MLVCKFSALKIGRSLLASLDLFSSAPNSPFTAITSSLQILCSQNTVKVQIQPAHYKCSFAMFHTGKKIPMHKPIILVFIIEVSKSYGYA